MDQYFDIIIVGGGPAGLTAAVYARRAGKSVLLLERESFGGQIASSPKVENFPGLPAVSGAELAERLYSQAEALGTRIELEEALEIQSGTPSRVVTDYGAYTAGAVILAAGMRRRTLGLAGEDRLAGISFCAVCDGAFYAGQDVAVAGGGSTALQDALYLADICRHVTVIHRRSDFRADPILVERAEKTANLTLLRSTVVEALEGSERLTGLTLRNTAVGEVSHLPGLCAVPGGGSAAGEPAGPVSGGAGGRSGLYRRRGGLPDADSRHLCGRGSPRQGGPPADHRLRGRRCGGPGGLPLLCLTPGHLLKNPYRPPGVPGGLCCSLHSSRRGGDFSVWAGSQDTVHPMERRPPVFRRPPGVYLMAKVTETVTCCSPSSPPCATQ